MYPLINAAENCKTTNLIYIPMYTFFFCTSSVLAEDAIKAALSDYKVKQENKKTQASSANN